jgi:hypothetical protein
MEATRPNFVFRDSAPESGGGPEDDPYEIPALNRRRKQRFFE